MRNTILFTTLALTAAAFAVSANAQDKAQTYVKVGVADADYGDAFTALNLGVGVDLNKSFAIEADGDIGLTDRNYSVSGVNVKAKLSYELGAFVVGKLPLSPNVDLTGRLGYMTAQVKASAGGYSASETVNGPAVGVGLRYFPKGGKNGVRFDATHVNFGDKDGTANIYQVAYVRRF